MSNDSLKNVFQSLSKKWAEMFSKIFNSNSGGFAKNCFQTIASEYIEIEKKSIESKYLISKLGLYPQLTNKMFWQLNEYLKTLVGDKLIQNPKIEVKILSTMLPMHFYNFPHKFHYKKKNYQINYIEGFVEKYKDTFKEIIESEEADLVRYTIVAENKEIANKLYNGEFIFFDSFIGNKIPLFEEYVVGDDYYFEKPHKVPMPDLLQNKENDFCEKLYGISKATLKKDKFLGHKIKTESVYLFDEIKHNNKKTFSINNRFINEFHSKNNARLVIVSENKNGDIINKNGTEYNVCNYKEFTTYPDGVLFRVKDGNEKIHFEFFFNAIVDIEKDIVKISIEYIDNENRSTNKYLKLIDNLEMYSNKLNFIKKSENKELNKNSIEEFIFWIKTSLRNNHEKSVYQEKKIIIEKLENIIKNDDNKIYQKKLLKYNMEMEIIVKSKNQAKAKELLEKINQEILNNAKIKSI